MEKLRLPSQGGRRRLFRLRDAPPIARIKTFGRKKKGKLAFSISSDDLMTKRKTKGCPIGDLVSKLFFLARFFFLPRALRSDPSRKKAFFLALWNPAPFLGTARSLPLSEAKKKKKQQQEASLRTGETSRRTFS